MHPTPDTTPLTPPRVRTRGGARRAPARSWREASIPLGAGDTAAVPPLRALCQRILHGWHIPSDTIDAVELALSELATNALIHTPGPVRVRLAHRGNTVRLDVADTSTHHPTPAAQGSHSEHGRGLILVAALACEGLRVEPYPGNPQAGKLIIAEFRLR